LKVVTASGWFAARPSGTESIYKIYAESFKDQSHLNAIVSQAEEIVAALNSSSPRSDSRQDGNEREGPAIEFSSVRAGIPRLRFATARHLAALALRYRRRGTSRVILDRSSCPSWTKLVADVAARSHRLRQLAVSIVVVFRRNGLLISPDWLIEDELLRASDCQARTFPQYKIDYSAVIPFKHGLFERAWANFRAGARADLRPAYEQFRVDQAHWLEDYALFRALKIRFGAHITLNGPQSWCSAKQRRSTRFDPSRRIKSTKYASRSFCCSAKANGLKAHAHRKGLSLIGDLPFFVFS